MTREETLRRRRGPVTAHGRPRHGRVSRFLAGATLTVLVGAPSWAGLAVPARAGQDPGCPPLNPIAKRYVDHKTVCRRARQEVLHSLRTGKDPDWDHVFRDSIPARHTRRYRPVNHGHHAPSEHASRPQPRSGPKPSASPSPTPRQSRTPTRRRIDQPQPRRSVTGSSSKAPSNRNAIPHHLRTDKRGPLNTLGRASVLLLLAMLGTVTIWRGKALRAKLDERRPRLRRPPSVMEPTSPRRRPGEVAPHDPFGWGGASLAGPGAEDAVRHLITDTLTHQREHAIELVLPRPDAWRLLGMTADDLQAERVPGLTLTDDAQEAYAHLRRPSFWRRLLVTYDDGDDHPHLQQQDERSSVLTVATSIKPSAQISANGNITPRPPSGPTTTEPHKRAPIISRSDAREQLLALPTLAKWSRSQRSPRSTSQPPP